MVYMADTFYDFFQQFTDITVDNSEYSDRYLKPFNIGFSNDQQVKVTLKNIFNNIKLIEELKKDISNFEVYRLTPGERVELTSYNIYGTIELWWVLCVFNYITNPLTQWCLSEEQIRTLAEKMVLNENKYSFDAYFTILSDVNESRRKITVPKRSSIPKIIFEFKKAFQEQNTGISI